jgi:hypothetical protein
MKKIYVIVIHTMFDEHSVYEKAFENKLDAQKEAYWLEQGSMDEDTGNVDYFTVKEIELQ